MIISLLFTFLSSWLVAQPIAEPIERWLVELETREAACLGTWWKEHGLDGSTYELKALPIGNWWVVEIPSGLSSSLRQQTCISKITPDHKITWRVNPNDPAYINQRDMNLIGMTKAWDIASGGVTAQGDTIVVAILDDGFQVDHEDLEENVWINHGEIPDDLVDNDDNGYVDDYRGLNIDSGNDQHPEEKHGTQVSGVIGAVGNNSTGVTGINWKVKLMLLSGADFESKIIELYQYAIDMRDRYNTTNGAEGAFVVVTNLSGGIDFAWAADHPLWCEMYDKLGDAGILSVVAAPNEPISVDVEGDMPTTCTSPFMIAVTNVDLTDVIDDDAGYGLTSIDLGAPGDGTINISWENKYAEFDGTSSATPHVAGAVALMYSTPCESFLDGIDANPKGTAERIRDILFSTAKPNNSLDEITVTGKRLQVDAAMQATVEECSPVVETGIQIFSIQPNPVRLEDTKAYFEVKGDTTTAFFEIYGSNGLFLHRIGITPEDYTRGFILIPAARFPAGLYLLVLRNGEEKVTRKFVVL